MVPNNNVPTAHKVHIPNIVKLGLCPDKTILLTDVI